MSRMFFENPPVVDLPAAQRFYEAVDILFPKALPLIPLTRCPGFVWMIAVGFALPTALSEGPDKNDGTANVGQSDPGALLSFLP